jgi:hypothetical protein
MNAKNQPGPEDEQEEVGAIDSRRGPMPTKATEDETAIDSRGLESDKKESDETGRNKH